MKRLQDDYKLKEREFAKEQSESFTKIRNLIKEEI